MKHHKQFRKKKKKMNAETNRLGEFPDTSNTVHCCSPSAATEQENGKC